MDAATLPRSTPVDPLAPICDELAEVCAQINVLQARVVELLADAEPLIGATGCRSLAHFAVWQTGASDATARSLATLARRRDELPTTVEAFGAGRLSLDQAATVASRAPAEGDVEWADLAQQMTVRQLRQALRIAVPPAPPEPGAPPRDERSVSFGFRDDGTWSASIRADAEGGALIEAGLRSHLDALHNERKAAGHDDAPFPGWFDALERMVDRSLEREAADRPWSQRHKVVVHLDVEADLARLHLGPALTAAERALLTCDASIVTVLERFGTPVSVGREHRITPDRTRLLVEQRDGGCVIPWCRATNKLVIHHIEHWEHGGPTDTCNLATVCPAHHRAIHAGKLRMWGNADAPDGLHVTDGWGRSLTRSTAADPPLAPPPRAPAPYRHPSGERIEWRWFDPPDFTPAV